MKKILMLFVVMISILLVTACGNKEKEVLKTCTLEVNNSTAGYKVESTYEIYGRGKVVEKVISNEIVTSESDEILNNFETTLNTTYKNMNDTYGGYTFNITKETGRVISNAEIDSTSMDFNKYINDNQDIKDYLDPNNKLLISGVESLYKSLGATCN